MMLLACGDVSSNPGPISYPCAVCLRGLHSNHRAIQCDSCQFWSHIGCVGVYMELQAKSDFSW